MKTKKHNKQHKYNRTLCSIALSSALAAVAVGGVGVLPVVAQASDSAGVVASTGKTLYLSESGSGVNHFTDLKRALESAQAGDTIVLKSNYLHREVGTEGLQIPKNVTIDGQGSHTLTVRSSVGKGIDMQGDLTLKNLTLNITEEGGRGGVINVGGHALTIENVSTKVYGTSSNDRPKIKADSGDHSHIIIRGGTEETRFDSISLGSNSVDIEIQSEHAPLGNTIDLSGAKNVSLSLSNTKPLTISGLGDGNLKKLTLDHTKIVLKQNLDVETLELRNGATFNVESTSGYDEFDDPSDYKIDVTTLKIGDGSNILDIGGNSSIKLAAIEGDAGKLNVNGNKSNITLEGSDYTYKNGTFTPKDSKPTDSSSTGNTETNPQSGNSVSTPTTTLSPAEPSPPPAAQTQGGQGTGTDPKTDASTGQAGDTSSQGQGTSNQATEAEKEQDSANQGGGSTHSSGDQSTSSSGSQASEDGSQGGESQGTEEASQDGKEGEQAQDQENAQQGADGQSSGEQSAGSNTNGQDNQVSTNTGTTGTDAGVTGSGSAGSGDAGANGASSGDAGAAAGSTSESQGASSSESSQGTGGSTTEGVGSSSSTVESTGSSDTETAASGNSATDQTAGGKTPAPPASDPNSPPSNSGTPSQPTGETPSEGGGSSQPNSGNGSDSSAPSTTPPSESGVNSGTTTPTPAAPATPPTTGMTQPGEQPESTPPSSGEGEKVEGAQNQGDETSTQAEKEKEKEKKQEQGAGSQTDGQTAGEQGSSGTGVGGVADAGTEVGSGGAASGSSTAGGTTGAEAGAGGSQGSETSAGGSGSGVVDSGSGSSDSKDTTAGTTNATDQAESGEHKEENGTQTGKEGEQANQTQDSEASPSKDEGSNPQSTPQGTEQPQSGDSNPQSPSTTEGDKEKTDPPAVTPVSPSGDSNTSTEDTREETEADSGKDKDGTEGGKDANLGGDTPEKNPDAPQTGTTTADTPQADGSHTVGENQGGDANGTQDDKGQDGDNVAPPAKPEVPPKDQSAVENQGDSKPSKPVADKPAVEQPAAEKPAVEKPAVEKPAADKPVEQPAEEKPTAEKPTAEKPTEEKPAEEKPAAEKPTAEKPTAEKPTAEKPAAEKPAAEKPTAEKPTAEKPTAEKPTAEKPTAEKPAAEKPAKEKPAEKSIKDRIIDTLKDWFGNAGLNDEKQQAQAAEKVENSLQELATSYSDYGLSFTADAARVADNRLNDLASLNGLESAATDNYAFLAQSARALKTRNSVWVSSSLGEQRGDSDSKRRSHSINLGYDRQFDNLILGGFVSYLGQKGERGELNSKLHGYAFSLYGKYSQDAHEIVALLNAGRTSAELKRNISALGVSNQADVKGKFAGLRAEYGYRMVFEQHGLQVKPIIAVNYNIGRQADFTERGSMPVHVGSIKAQRFAVEAGVELKKYFETAYVYIKPTVQTDLMARSNDVDIRFVNLPNSIPFKSATKKKTSFALSLGTQVQLRRNLLLDLNANSRFAKNERDVQGNVKLSYKF